MANIEDQKLLYHLTDINNLKSIFSNGLKPRNKLSKFIDVADSEIIQGRKVHGLEGYVPFHWFSRNPFDGRVQKDFPDSDFVLITVTREIAKKANWKVILKHPLAESNISIFDYNTGFGLIDWDTMNKRDYSNHHCKSICMAECLSPETVYISDFFKIYTPTTSIENSVKNLLVEQSQTLDVVTNRGMFINGIHEPKS